MVFSARRRGWRVSGLGLRAERRRISAGRGRILAVALVAVVWATPGGIGVEGTARAADGSAGSGAAAGARVGAAGSAARAVAGVETGQDDRFDVVVVDAGHGGHDEGALGPTGLREKDLVLDVTRRVGRRLTAAGLRVVLTRRDDRFLSLEERTAVANDAHADLFLSIHANASTSRSPRGIETYFAALESSDEESRRVAERENTALGARSPSSDPGDPLAMILGDLIETEHLQESSEFAKLAEGGLSKVANDRSRGVKQAPFVVLMGVRMPAALVEIGFVTHPDEEEQLRRDRQKERIAEALTAAVVDFGKRYDARRGVKPVIRPLPAARATR
jgi:N-acetylmuramoyl-L-alanine amidase